MVFITDPVSSVKHTKYVANDCVMFCSFNFRSSIILFYSVLFVLEGSLTVYIWVGEASLVSMSLKVKEVCLKDYSELSQVVT